MPQPSHVLRKGRFLSSYERRALPQPACAGQWPSSPTFVDQPPLSSQALGRAIVRLSLRASPRLAKLRACLASSGAGQRMLLGFRALPLLIAVPQLMSFRPGDRTAQRRISPSACGATSFNSVFMRGPTLALQLSNFSSFTSFTSAYGLCLCFPVVFRE